MYDLTLNEANYQTLCNLQGVCFTHEGVYYETTFTELPIEEAQAWLAKQNRLSYRKRTAAVVSRLSEWLPLAISYKQLLEIIYPRGIAPTKLLIKSITDSGILNCLDMSEFYRKLETYWLTKLNETPKGKCLSDILTIGRVAIKLQFLTDNYIEFNQMFDLEVLYGNSEAQTEFQFTLFSFMKDACTTPDWSYTDQDWKLLQRSLINWKSWQLRTPCTEQQAKDLWSKYLGLNNIPDCFFYWIWRCLNPDINTKWYRPSGYTFKEYESLDLVEESESYLVLGITPTTSYSEAKAKYNELMKRYHPDVTTNPDNQELSVKVSTAWKAIKHTLPKN